MIIHEYTGLSFYAPYLINGDSSGLSGEDIDIANAWIKFIGLGMPVSCRSIGYSKVHDMKDFDRLSGDCEIYVFLEASKS